MRGNYLLSVTYNVVLVEEVGGPGDGTDLSWLLITTLPIETVEDVLRVIDYYVARWTVEIYFRTLKTGCRVEDIQLETTDRLKRCLAFYKIIAWRVLYLTYLNRTCPKLPCTAVFDESEWKSVWRVVTKKATSEKAAYLVKVHEIVNATRRLQQPCHRGAAGTAATVGRTPPHDRLRHRLACLRSKNVKGQKSCIKNSAPLGYSITVDGKPVLLRSRLGLELADNVKLGETPVVLGEERKSADNHWENLYGKNRDVRDHYNELNLALKGGDHTFGVVMRAYDDGVAFRLVLPKQPGMDSFTVTRDATEFTFADDHQIWAGWNNAEGAARPEDGFIGSQEWRFLPNKLSGLNPNFKHGLPVLVQTRAACVAITESDLLDWSAMWLVISPRVRRCLPVSVSKTQTTPLLPRTNNSLPSTTLARAPFHATTCWDDHRRLLPSGLSLTSMFSIFSVQPAPI